MLRGLATEHPDQLERELLSPPGAVGAARCCTFNRWGTLLAVGHTCGCIVIWDVAVRCYNRVLLQDDHDGAAVVSLSWSLNGQHVLAAYSNSLLRRWDIVESRVDRRQSVEAIGTVLRASLSPLLAKLALVAFVEDGREPVLVDLATGLVSNIPISGSNGMSAGKTITNAIFDPSGLSICAGTTCGDVLVICSRSFAVRQTIEVPTKTAVRSIEISKNGSFLLTSGSDRVIRVLILTTRELEREFLDIVNRASWKTCKFSGNGEYLCGAAGGKLGHQLYIWDRGLGQLLTILQGPFANVIDLAWHPKLPLIISIGAQGKVFLWNKSVVERWSAYAPNFEVLDANVYYDEREDEFDIHSDADEPNDLSDEIDVDIMNCPSQPESESSITSGGEIRLLSTELTKHIDDAK